ncbi:MAG: hypothetical protein WCC92_06690 [Candidatus Korobacteraceae bacterium]
MIDRVSRGYAMSLRALLVWSTLVALFSEAARYKAGIDIKAFYFVMLFNTLVLVSMGQFVVNRPLVIFYIYLAFSGLVSIAAGTNTLRAFSEQFLGISFTSLYFYNFFRFEHFDFRRLFIYYTRLAYYVCWIGILMVPFQHAFSLTKYFRAQSVLTEPAQFMMIVMPAIYYFLEASVFQGKHRFESMIGLFAIFLADSAVGYMGLMLILIYLVAKSRHKLLLVTVPLIVVLGVGGLRLISPNFRFRFDDTAKAVTGLTVANVNTSTYATISNAFVAAQVLRESPILGNGLGSHERSHEKYLPDIPGISGFSAENQLLNKEEAASLFIRIASDLGFLGLCLTAMFLWRFRLSTPDSSGTINTAILIYLILKLIRAGHYFPPEFFFFVFAYIFSRLHEYAQQRGVTSAARLRPLYPTL